jgi:outer membrane protein assembly factor BamD (BamD/ComL family)
VSPKSERKRRWPTILLTPVAACLLGAVGCAGTQAVKGDATADNKGGSPGWHFGSNVPADWWNPSAYTKADAPPPPIQTVTLRPEGLVPDKQPEPGTVDAELAGARELFRQGEYSKAESIFHYHAEKTTNPPMVQSEARYYEAECLRLEGDYPKAADSYVDVLNKYPNNPHREQALQHVFDIANFWLDATREQMRESVEVRDGKRWFVTPRFVSFDQKVPLIDREGRAIEKLEQVRYNDINGPLADKALFLCGSVKFYNEDFRDADFYFSQIYEKHKDSPLAPKAIELAIAAKQMGTGGAEYDGKKCAEARKLVQAALTSYPELAGDPEKRKLMEHQLVGITLQQAEKDFLMAEFWRRTKHPGAAYWYYGLVIQRYPTTTFAQKARKAMEEIKADVEKEAAEQANKKPLLPNIFSSDSRDNGSAPRQLPSGFGPGK